MKTSEVVFELVLVPFQFTINGTVNTLDDLLSGKVNGPRNHEQPYLTRTHVRIRTAEHLLWVVRAVDTRLWGLVGKSRFVLYHFESEQFYPLFKKDEAFGNKVWRLNSEIIRFFEKELATTRFRKAKQLRLPLDVTAKDATNLADAMLASRQQVRSIAELKESEMPIRKDELSWYALNNGLNPGS